MNRILLLSYPRSGNSLVKYFLKRSIKATTVHDCVYQRASKRKKIVTKEWEQKQVKIGNYLFKEHSSKNCTSFDSTNDSLILVIRNYKECIFRHNKRRALNSIDFRKAEIKKYMDNIRFYDNWSGKKRILYYEDLIVNFRKYYMPILEIVDVDKKEHKNLFSALSFHMQACLKQYDKVCGSQTKGKAALFHSKTLPPGLIKEMNKYAKQDKELYNKYLSRY